MPEINANGSQIHYQLEGSENDPVLFFSNSLGSDLTMWDAVMPRLQPHFRILRYDTRGHGKTDATPGAYTIAELGEDWLALLNALQIEKVHFCGLSMGGLIGQWIAIHHPGRINKLVLSNTAAKIGTADRWNERAAIVQQQGVQAIASTVLDRWFTDAFKREATETMQRLLQMFLSTSSTGYAACCSAIRDADFREAITRITAPTLIITGTFDQATTIADGKLMQNQIPNAQFLELPTAHLSSVEAPDQFSSALIRFLSADTYERGMEVRRAVLGDAHVDRANAKLNAFNGEFQDFITRYAWGEVWARPGLPRHSRSLITLAMLIALNREAEFKMHVRAAFNNGVTVEEIKEVILQSALYCGLPAANAAFHAAEEVFRESGISTQPS